MQITRFIDSLIDVVFSFIMLISLRHSTVFAFGLNEDGQIGSQDAIIEVSIEPRSTHVCKVTDVSGYLAS